MGTLGFFVGMFKTKTCAQASGDFFGREEYVGKTRKGRFKKFYVQYFKPFKRVDGDKWKLKITGLCENPQEIDLVEIKKLSKKTQVSRIKCVECWSAKAQWEGFHISHLHEKVRPLPDAEGVVFRCADSYNEYLPLNDLTHERALLVHTMNKEPLSDEHGFPLRVIVPFKYGYKSPKAVLEMEYVKGFHLGTWSKIGPYSLDGTILPGYDHPLDMGKKRRKIFGGEIFDY
jgi:DMSO/TMAO reductase YedYZ molybdopterin-dependent catalytic subunit